MKIILKEGAVNVYLQMVKTRLIEFMRDEDEIFGALFKVSLIF